MEKVARKLMKWTIYRVAILRIRTSNCRTHQKEFVLHATHRLEQAVEGIVDSVRVKILPVKIAIAET